MGALLLYLLYAGNLIALDFLDLNFVLAWLFTLLMLCAAIRAWPVLVAAFPSAERSWSVLIVFSIPFSAIVSFSSMVVIFAPLDNFFRTGSGGIGTGVGMAALVLVHFFWLLIVLVIPRCFILELYPGAFGESAGDSVESSPGD